MEDSFKIWSYPLIGVKHRTSSGIIWMSLIDWVNRFKSCDTEATDKLALVTKDGTDICKGKKDSFYHSG